MGQPAATDRLCLRSLSHSFTLDFLLGLAGTKAEAEEIKARLSTFLGTKLNLALAAEKTLITHAYEGRARFLGYEIGTMKTETRLDDLKRRSVNEGIKLYIPEDVIQTGAFGDSDIL